MSIIKKQLLINNILLSANKQIPQGLADLIKEYIFYDRYTAEHRMLLGDICFSFSTHFLCTSRASPNGVFDVNAVEKSIEEEIDDAGRCEHWSFRVTNFDHMYFDEVDMQAINCSKCGGYIMCQTAPTYELPFRIQCDGQCR
jgi:hypothetical protein